jgi:hypothetical protein
VLHSGKLQPHPQTLHKAAVDKHSSLLQKFVNYGRKKFYSTGPRCHCQYLQIVLQTCLDDSQGIVAVYYKCVVRYRSTLGS